MQVRLLQTSLHWEDKKANLQKFSRQIEQATPADLVVLPEMFTTGFTMNASALAESMNGPTLQWMQKTARDTGAAICGSLIIREKEQYYNRLIWMPPTGPLSYYDKRHLFTLAGEEKTYRPGTERKIVSFRGWQICLQICYDLRFPVWSRNTDGYDLLIYVANFPRKRQYAWDQLLIARAIENQCYTLGVNRVGFDGNQVAHAGGSAIIDYRGEVLSRAGDAEQTLRLELDKRALDRFRKRYPFWRNRDAFQFDRP